MSILGVAIVPPHPTVLSLRMAVAIYVTGISTPEVHPEFPPLPGTLTSGQSAMEPCDERSESLGSSLPTTRGEGPTEALSSRRWTHGRIGFHVWSSVGGFEGTIYSVATSMSTRLPLETDRRVCVPFRHDLLGGLIHEYHAVAA